MYPLQRYLAGLALFSWLTVGVADDSNGYRVYTSDASFDAVMSALTMAIEERGMYINNVMHMDEMLSRTGKDLGLGPQLFRHAQSVEFCSAVLSRKMIAENPARVVNCPFILSVYQLPDSDQVHLVHRDLQSLDDSPVMREVAAMLSGVAEAAAEGF
jgi:uncharacterized protein (DUF302 family)